LVVACIKCNHKKQSDFRYISNLVKIRKNKLVRLRKYARENGFGLWVRPIKPIQVETQAQEFMAA